MKYQPGLLDPFISPVTGKLRSHNSLPNLDFDYIFEGNLNNIAVPSLRLKDLRIDFVALRKNIANSTFIVQKPIPFLESAQALNALNDGILKHKKGVVEIAIPGEDYLPFSLPFANIWIGNLLGKPVAQPKILTFNLPDLPSTKLWIGNESNRPVESQIITIDNLPNLGTNFLTGKGKIWRGTAPGRPVESDDLSSLEISNTIAHLGFAADIAAINADIILINGSLIALGASVAALQSEVIILADQIGDLREDVTALQLEVVLIIQRIDNLRLNTILADADVSFYNFKLINLADPINPTDGVNLRTLTASIASLDVTLQQFVIGGPAVAGVITTARGPTCLLTNIPAGGNVSMDNFAITNLETLEANSWAELEAKAQNGLNFLFIWKLFGGGVR